jgi:hypothetical protein
MTVRSGILCALASLAVVAPVAAPAETNRTDQAQKITRSGVGKVKVGARYSKLRSAGLVGRLRTGCELGGPGERIARLRAPLKGSVELTRSTPRKVRTIMVTGGATARGVGIGDAISDIKAAYPKAKVDHSTESVFRLTLVRVPRSGGGRIAFAVSTDTDKIEIIGVPAISFCD